jgi:hypothetical protein
MHVVLGKEDEAVTWKDIFMRGGISAERADEYDYNFTDQGVPVVLLDDLDDSILQKLGVNDPNDRSKIMNLAKQPNIINSIKQHNAPNTASHHHTNGTYTPHVPKPIAPPPYIPQGMLPLYL